MRQIGIVLGLALICGAVCFGAFQLQFQNNSDPEAMKPEAGIEAKIEKINDAMRLHVPSYEGSSASGSYLSGGFAQRHHDWNTAGRYIGYVLKAHDNNPALLKRAMVLAMGDGDYENAMRIARIVIEEHESTNALSHLFLAAEALKNKEYESAAFHVASIPEASLSPFILPLLHGWTNAALGEYDTENLQRLSIHIYHAVMISKFLGREAPIKNMLKNALSAGELGLEDVERIADIYAHIGETENALSLYQKALVIEPANQRLQKKLKLAQASKTSQPGLQVKNAESGLAEAFYDMARLMAQDYSDESARVFARMSLYLDPELTRTKVLLARVSTRNDRYDEAVSLYKSIEPDSDYFLSARRNVADILHKQERSEEAIAELKVLTQSYEDLDAQIQIGNIHRENEHFKKAIGAYNVAEQKLGSITEKYWHLHYVRGMSYEQDGQWKNAEKDLRAALGFRPDHPYVLNYLGYAWADQGENLEKSLEMIQKAVDLRPGDGYITDSLGWVYYRMGRYEDAVPYLEQAVELMPYDPVINDHLGDAYWKVGRKLEAEFQWIRAKNHSDDAALISTIDEKLINGLDIEAETSIKTADTPISAEDINESLVQDGRGQPTNIQ